MLLTALILAVVTTSNYLFNLCFTAFVTQEPAAMLLSMMSAKAVAAV
jgi:hypothetical protein